MKPATNTGMRRVKDDRNRGYLVKPIHVGLVGYGGIGRVHALAYRAIPFHYGLPADTVQIVGVATSRPETAEKAAHEIGCVFWTDDYNELLARDDVDVID